MYRWRDRWAPAEESKSSDAAASHRRSARVSSPNTLAASRYHRVIVRCLSLPLEVRHLILISLTGRTYLRSRRHNSIAKKRVADVKPWCFPPGALSVACFAKRCRARPPSYISPHPADTRLALPYAQDSAFEGHHCPFASTGPICPRKRRQWRLHQQAWCSQHTSSNTCTSLEPIQVNLFNTRLSGISLGSPLVSSPSLPCCG